MARALQSNLRVLQLDLRMCGASWQDQVTLERAVAANNAALHQPLPLRDMLKVLYARARLADKLLAVTRVSSRTPSSRCWAGESENTTHGAESPVNAIK